MNWAINQDGDQLSVSYGKFCIDGIPSVNVAKQFIQILKDKEIHKLFNDDGTAGFAAAVVIGNIIEDFKSK